MKKLGLLILGLVLVAACTHKPVEKRTPAVSEESLQPADMGRLRVIVTNKDSVHFQQMLLKMRTAQTLVSSFDVRLARILNEDQMDTLFQSRLYCKLWQVQSDHEHTEEQLQYVMTVAKIMGSSATDWIYDQMSFFAKGDVAREAAMANLFRGFADEEMKICGRAGCVAEDVSKLKNFHLNPLNNSDLGRFMSQNKAAIAFYSQVEDSDLKPGDCFNPNSTRKPQAVGYDWANRNWVGSALPAGQFVFTYDDGPHSSYTRQIRDTWAEAGLPKPTFFWLRQNVSHLPDIVTELNKQGYVIGSHSERHADLGNLAKATSAVDFNGVNKQIFNAEASALKAGSAFETWKNTTLDREINQSVADLSTILGKPVRYFRLPYGSGVRNDLIGARFQALDLDHFFWRVDSLDWQDKNPESIRDRVVTQMKTVGKGIVLFHDIHPQSAAAAKLMVDYLKTSPTYKAVSIRDIPGLRP